MQQSIQASPLWLRRLNPYRWFKANPKSIAVENLPSNLILPMQKAIIQDNSFSARSSAGSVSGLASIMFPLLFFFIDQAREKFCTRALSEQVYKSFTASLRGRNSLK